MDRREGEISALMRNASERKSQKTYEREYPRVHLHTGSVLLCQSKVVVHVATAFLFGRCRLCGHTASLCYALLGSQ